MQINGPFNGYTDLPVAGDMNLDGIDDLGIWVPNRQGSPTANVSEWYFVLSDHIGQTLPHNVFDQYSPTPLGNDLFAQFGDHFSLPIFGNFDPPVSGNSARAQTNSLNRYDVNNDGLVTPLDALIVINRLNAGNQAVPAAASSNYWDVNSDKLITPLDALWVINYLNSHPNTAQGEGESNAIDAVMAAGDQPSSDIVQDDLLGMLAAEAPTKPRVLRSLG